MAAVFARHRREGRAGGRRVVDNVRRASTHHRYFGARHEPLHGLPALLTVIVIHAGRGGVGCGSGRGHERHGRRLRRGGAVRGRRGHRATRSARFGACSLRTTASRDVWTSHDVRNRGRGFAAVAVQSQARLGRCRCIAWSPQLTALRWGPPGTGPPYVSSTWAMNHRVGVGQIPEVKRSDGPAPSLWATRLV